MDGKTMDRRVRKTKQHLRLALMSLMSEKNVNSISVRELAERADINRGTFYIHYKDVNDLLLQLEDEMAEELIQVCHHHIPYERKAGESFPFLTELYQFILDHADLCKVLLGVNGDHAYTERICATLCDEFLYDYLSMYFPDQKEKVYHFSMFIMAGNLKLALAWLQGGAKESPEEMAILAGNIIMSGIGVLKQ